MKRKYKIFSKEPNHKSFKYINTWKISRGWYDDGDGQFITKFEPMHIISTFNHHYYRFRRYGAKDTTVYWLDLNFFENIWFCLMQFTGQNFYNCLSVIATVASIISIFM